MQSDDWFSLTELTARLGALAWVEKQLGDLLAGWSAVEEHAPAAIVFAATGAHHHWHSEIVGACLPTSPQLQADGAIKAPTNGWQQAIPTLVSLADPSATATRLKVLAKIVDPWLDREIAALRDLSRPVSDAAMLRWLRFVVLDHDDDHGAITQLLLARANDPVRFEDHALLTQLDLTA